MPGSEHDQRTLAGHLVSDPAAFYLKELGHLSLLG